MYAAQLECLSGTGSYYCLAKVKRRGWVVHIIIVPTVEHRTATVVTIVIVSCQPSLDEVVRYFNIKDSS